MRGPPLAAGTVIVKTMIVIVNTFRALYSYTRIHSSTCVCVTVVVYHTLEYTVRVTVVAVHVFLIVYTAV